MSNSKNEIPKVLRVLSKKQLRDAAPISRRDIEIALKKGRKDQAAANAVSKPISTNPRIRFRS